MLCTTRDGQRNERRCLDENFPPFNSPFSSLTVIVLRRICGRKPFGLIGVARSAGPCLAFAPHQVFPQFLGRPLAPPLGFSLGHTCGNPLGLGHALSFGWVALVCHDGVIAQMWINRKMAWL